jgi:bifunctional N-acetylglucosamine-1-phosphate-uridyltransferase/glucosamine-1-phosphate-acetyltransferase GlmU-like protein
MAVPKLRVITTNPFAGVNSKPMAMAVRVADGRYVAPGALITTQTAASSLPSVQQKRTAQSSWTGNTHLRLVVNNC